jgi:hypothetical protein
MAPVFRRLLGR